jgi:hypothetical protein
MAVERKQVGETLHYRGHEIVARFLGPDLLCYVDGSELSPFYEDTNAAQKAGMRHVDQIEREREGKNG